MADPTPDPPLTARQMVALALALSSSATPYDENRKGKAQVPKVDLEKRERRQARRDIEKAKDLAKAEAKRVKLEKFSQALKAVAEAASTLRKDKIS